VYTSRKTVVILALLLSRNRIDEATSRDSEVSVFYKSVLKHKWPFCRLYFICNASISRHASVKMSQLYVMLGWMGLGWVGLG